MPSRDYTGQYNYGQDEIDKGGSGTAKDYRTLATGNLGGLDIPWQNWRKTEKISSDQDSYPKQMWDTLADNVPAAFSERVLQPLGLERPGDNDLARDAGYDDIGKATGPTSTADDWSPGLELVYDQNDPRYKQSMADSYRANAGLDGRAGFVNYGPASQQEQADAQAQGYAQGGSVKAAIPPQPMPHSYPHARASAKAVLHALRLHHMQGGGKPTQSFDSGGSVDAGPGGSGGSGFANIQNQYDTFDSNENYMKAFFDNQARTNQAWDSYLTTGTPQRVAMEGWDNTIGKNYAGQGQGGGGRWTNAPAQQQDNFTPTTTTTYADGSNGDSSSSGDGNSSPSSGGGSSFTQPRQTFNPGGKFGVGYAMGGSVRDNLAPGQIPLEGGGGTGGPYPTFAGRPAFNMRGMSPAQRDANVRNWGAGRMDMYDRGQGAIPPAPQFGQRVGGPQPRPRLLPNMQDQHQQEMDAINSSALQRAGAIPGQPRGDGYLPADAFDGDQ